MPETNYFVVAELLQEHPPFVIGNENGLTILDIPGGVGRVSIPPESPPFELSCAEGMAVEFLPGNDLVIYSPTSSGAPYELEGGRAAILFPTGGNITIEIPGPIIERPGVSPRIIVKIKSGDDIKYLSMLNAS